MEQRDRRAKLMLSRIIAALLVSVLLGACASDPDVAKRKLVETGNKYFAMGRYKEASIIYRRAIQKDRRFGEAYFRYALTEQRLGRFQQALAAFTRAVELDPENIEAYGKLADLYLAIYLSAPARQEQVLGEIQRLTERAEQYFPDSIEVHRIKAFVALSKRDYPEALRHFQLANQRAPDDRRIALGLAQSLAGSDREDEALELARSYLEKDPTFAGMYDFIYLQYARANRMDEALAILRAKCDKNPQSLLFRLQLARHFLVTRNRREMEATLKDLLENSDKFPNTYQSVGDFYFRIRDFDEAIEIYRQGMEKEPANRASFRNKTVEALALQGKYDQAFRLTEGILKDEPENAPALALRGALRLRSQDRAELDAATSDLEAALASMPANAVLRYNLAEAYRAQGNLDRALVEYQTAIAKRADYLPPRYRLAGLYIERGEGAKAVAETEEILGLFPQDVQARLIRASAWLQLGEVKQARDSLEKIIKQAPGARNAIYQLALIDYREKKYGEAERLFRQLAESVPPDIRGLLGLSDVYVAQKKPDEAVEVVRSALAENPEHVGLKTALGSVLSAVGRYDESAEVLQEVLERRPDDASVHRLIGGVYYSAGKLTEAETHLKRSSEMNPNDPSPILYLGMIAERRGAMQQAGAYYEHVLELTPDNAVALNNLAYVIAETSSDLDRALSLIQQARSLAPKDPNIADTLAYVYIKKRVPESALPILKEVVAKHPRVVIWRYHLAMALYQKGKVDQVKAQLKIALSHQPSEEEKYMIQELLAKVGT